MSESELWDHRPGSGYPQGLDLIGYEVEAVDGSIGKIDKHSADVGSSYLVVDTGPWIFGRRVLLPAGTITRVDTSEEKVYVDRTKDRIKDAPAFDEAKYAAEPTYLEQFARYYGQPHM
ncbi:MULTISPECIES: PRC-barrel domain-containing protein [Streptomyces]|uniref:PRC domain containing protein n=1 Tax=Streptomyces viridochromogenes TaxID=1938 RepID=A0A0L8J1V6_STRVR|nr:MULTISPECIES: PRC-barrel domain-containing protein [Streptomyces]KOG07439.1 PRC domain containing protein [Streptomyces viridochromogenes]